MIGLVKELCALPGVSGKEGAVREYILKKLSVSPAKIKTVLTRSAM